MFTGISGSDFSLRASHPASAFSIVHLLPQDIHSLKQNTGTTTFALPPLRIKRELAFQSELTLRLAFRYVIDPG
jgi:hypothetical protein